MENKTRLELINGSLFINNFPVDNSRKLMKLKIYLGSKSEISDFKMDNKDIIVTFNTKEMPIIIELSNKIEHFIINSLIIEIEKNTELEQYQQEENEIKSVFEKQKEKLLWIKTNEIEESDDYMSFKEECDSILSIKLRDYQYKSVYTLVNGGGFDFSVPGAGKTIISYAAYGYLKKKDEISSIFIIGPLNSYNAWFDEYITCYNTNPNFINLASMNINEVKSYLLTSEKNHSEITFINIDKAKRLKNQIIEYINDNRVLLIIDEGHKEKNPNAQITKAVLEISKCAKKRFILTGTPMPNGYEDLFSLSKIFSPYNKILPYSYSQLSTFTKKGIGENDEKVLMNSIKPFYSRVSKKYLLDKGELLEPNYKIINCDLNEDQKRIYNFLNEIACEIDDDWEYEYNLSLMKAVLIRKMQVSANPGLLLKSIIQSIDEYKKQYYEEFENDDSLNDNLIKADNEIRKRISNSEIYKIISRFNMGIIDINKNNVAIDLAINLVKEGKKVIIWDVFVQNMTVLKESLEKKCDAKIEIINGSVSGEDRQIAIDNFRNKNSMILISNPATLAESISLHKACQNAIYVNRNFNAAEFIQSKDRIHRINMPKGTTANYYFIINSDTVDEEINTKLQLKEERMLRILDSEEILISGNDFENGSFVSKEDVIESYRK